MGGDVVPQEAKLAAVPDIAESDLAATALAEPSAVALDAFVPHIEPIPTFTEDGTWRWSLVVALLLHAGVLIAFAVPASDMVAGGSGTDLEAISIDLVQASAIEVIAAAPTIASASPADARLANLEGGERQQTASLEIPDRKPERSPEAPAKAETADLVIPNMTIRPEPPVPDVPSLVIAPKKVEEVAEGPEKPENHEAKPEATALSTQSAPTEAATAEQMGGATSQGFSVIEMAARSAAIARAGEIDAYKSRVGQAVRQNRPRPPASGEKTGRVVIEFALTVEGALDYARVQASSGNQRLNDITLAAVRSTQFPRPPIGSKPGQLIYTMEYIFR